MNPKIRVKVPDDYLLLYRLIARTRALNESIIVYKEHIPGVRITGLGQEIVSVAPLFALGKLGILETSVKNPDHRTAYGTAVVVDHFCGTGGDVTRDLLRNYFARDTGGNFGRDGNVHWLYPKQRILGLGSSDMGRWVGVAVGMAEEIRRREWKNVLPYMRPVGISFFGDGAAQQGGVHEALNWAAASNAKRDQKELEAIGGAFIDAVTKETRVLRGAPSIFVIHDNELALFTDARDEHGASRLARRADGYGDMVGVDVCGFDPLAVFSETAAAVCRAQKLQSTLMVIHTYRLTGHNEVQIRHRNGSLEKGDFFDVEDVFGLDETGLLRFRDAVKREPVFHGFSETLIENGYAARGLLNSIVEEERRYVYGMAEEILKEPKVSVEKDMRDRSVFPSFPPPRPIVGSEKKKMKYTRSLSWIVGKLMEEDESVTYRGEDSSSKEGGVLGLTFGIRDRLGPARIFNTPISEEAITATALGAVLVGGKPICEMQFAPFFWDGAVVYAHAAAPQWFQKKMNCGFITVAPFGIVHGGGSGHYHEAPIERFLLPMEGIVVVAPANAYEVVGLMRALHEYGGPSVFLHQISAAGMPEFESDVPLDPYTLPIGTAEVVCEGSDVTVVTYGAACVGAAKNEAGTLRREGILLDVINLRTVFPWDTEAIRASVKKTGRLVVFHEDYHARGVGSMLVGSLVHDAGCMEYMKTGTIPVVGASTMFVPTDLDLVWDRLPYERQGKGVHTRHRSPRLAKKVKELMEWA